MGAVIMDQGRARLFSSPMIFAPILPFPLCVTVVQELFGATR
jgi:hypothetical protein